MNELVLQIGIALLTVAGAGAVGVAVYFRQREHELIIERYLKNTVDLIAEDVERVIEGFNHNWARTLEVITAYRDSDIDFDISQLEKGYVELRSGNLRLGAHHRLATLVGTFDFWVVYQKALAYFTTANGVVVKEIPDVIRLKLESERIESDANEVADKAVLEAKKRQEESHQYMTLVILLQRLASIVESKKWRFKELRRFPENPEVKQVLAELRAEYQEMLDDKDQ